MLVDSTRDWPESHNWTYSTDVFNFGCDIAVRWPWRCLHQLSKGIYRCELLPDGANLAGHAEIKPSVSLSGRS